MNRDEPPRALQLGDDGIDGCEMVEPESAQFVGIEIVPRHVGVVAQPERLLKAPLDAVRKQTCSLFDGGKRRHHRKDGRVPALEMGFHSRK